MHFYYYVKVILEYNKTLKNFVLILYVKYCNFDNICIKDNFNMYICIFKKNTQ